MTDIRLDDAGTGALVSDLRGHSAGAAGRADDADGALADAVAAARSPELVAALATFAERFHGSGGQLAEQVGAVGSVLETVRTSVVAEDGRIAVSARRLAQ